MAARDIHHPRHPDFDYSLFLSADDYLRVCEVLSISCSHALCENVRKGDISHAKGMSTLRSEPDLRTRRTNIPLVQ
jgi:hypothetical protein